MGTGHRLSTGAWTAALGVAVGMPLVEVAVFAGLATSVAGGRFSPDIDQYAAWDRATGWFQPSRWGRGWSKSGAHGMWRHRCVTHWWGWEALAAWAVLGWVPQALWFVALAPVAGWTSHLVGDFVIGAAGGGRGAGIPVLPWGPWVGLGFHCHPQDARAWHVGAERLVVGVSVAGSVAWVAGRLSGRW
jgi:hypothetical protein